MKMNAVFSGQLLFLVRELDEIFIQQQAGGANDAQRDAEQLEKGDGKNTEKTGSETNQQGEIGQHYPALLLEGKLSSGKEIAAVFNRQKKDGPEDGQKSVEQRTDRRQQIEEEEQKHADEKQADLFQLRNQDCHTFAPEGGKGERFVIQTTGADFLSLFGQKVIKGRGYKVADGREPEENKNRGDQNGNQPQNAGEDVPVPGIALGDIVDDGVLKKAETKGKEYSQYGDGNTERYDDIKIEFFVAVDKTKGLERIEEPFAEARNRIVREKVHIRAARLFMEMESR